MTEIVQEFLEFVVQSAFWCVIIYFAMKVLQHYLIQKNLEVEAITQYLIKHVHAVNIEREGDMLYWFDADDHRFIAQGRSIDEIVVILRQDWQRHVFIVDDVIFGHPDFEPRRIDQGVVKTLQANLIK